MDKGLEKKLEEKDEKMKDGELKKLAENEWRQSEVIHCPDPKCTGMLLQNGLKYR